jgi:hypothetical protein
MHRGKKLDAISASHHPKKLWLCRQIPDALPDEQTLGAAVKLLDACASGRRLQVAQQAPNQSGFA